MRIPVMTGLIDRRILANFRVRPEQLAAILPAPFRPQIVRGWGIAGICLIRLKQIRPRFLSVMPGISSENAAHRIAVEWDADGVTRQGVYVPRRDTSSRLNVLAGGRLFPGEHHHATFDVTESATELRIDMRGNDGQTRVLVHGRPVETWPAESVFDSLPEASKFFEGGSLGYSATSQPGQYDGLELRTMNWHVEPLAVVEIRSSFFEDQARFPPGSVEFDCALLMRNIRHEWHGKPTLCCETPETVGGAR